MNPSKLLQPLSAPNAVSPVDSPAVSDSVLTSTATAPGTDCLLTLALPLALEEEVLDLLRESSDLTPGFTVAQAQGLGRDVLLTTAMEQVQGRARRVLVYAVMGQANVAPLLERLRARLQSPVVFYWVQPLLDCGRLGAL